MKDRETKLIEHVQSLSIGLKQSEDIAKIRETTVVHNIEYGALLDSKNEKVKKNHRCFIHFSLSATDKVTN